MRTCIPGFSPDAVKGDGEAGADVGDFKVGLQCALQRWGRSRGARADIAETIGGHPAKDFVVSRQGFGEDRDRDCGLVIDQPHGPGHLDAHAEVPVQQRCLREASAGRAASPRSPRV